MMYATVKACRLLRGNYTNSKGVGGAIALFMILSGCAAPNFNASSLTWKTYSNTRYGFEFPYPSNWTALPPPENNDGIAFVSPQNNSVVIRGWAGNQLTESRISEGNTKTTVNNNFRTSQGLTGVLLVSVGNKESSMTLTLTQGQVKYYWQGRSQSQEFPEYYRLFSYIAQQYRISQ